MNYRKSKVIEAEIKDLESLIRAKARAAAAHPGDPALSLSIGQYRHRLKHLQAELEASQQREEA